MQKDGDAEGQRRRRTAMQNGGSDNLREGNFAATAQSPWTVFLVFLRLGLTSFGGPVAHLGYFREAFVERRRWFSEQGYADLVALCQFLPGPASSQVGMAIGLTRAGFLGAVAAWVGFTLPSALLLIAFAVGVVASGDALPTGVLQGLKVVAVAVVARAVWGMARKLLTDSPRIVVALVATGIMVAWPHSWGAGTWAQIAVIVSAALLGSLVFRVDNAGSSDPFPITLSRRYGAICLALFFGLLVGLPILDRVMMTPDRNGAVSAIPVDRIDAFYRSGALVFGGGHVVLPLLQAEVVPPGWVSKDSFMAGYGAAQGVPGPLFSFGAYLGASMTTPPNGIGGGILGVVSLFLPSLLLVPGVLPFWDRLRHLRRARGALACVNAAVVGLLAAAFYDPVCSSGLAPKGDVSVECIALAVTAFVALEFGRVPSWSMVLVCGALGGVIAL